MLDNAKVFIVLILASLSALLFVASPSDSFEGSSVQQVSRSAVEAAAPYQLLKSSIEALYGRQITIEQVRADNPDYCGETSVTGDGTPVIRVNAKITAQEPVIAHELLHLKLRKEGYPRYVVYIPPDIIVDPEVLTEIRRMTNNVRDLLEHYVFLFPEMERMGLNPYENMRAIYRRNIESGYVNTFRNPANRVYNYMKIVLESNDSRMAADLERCYEANNWHAALKKGRQLVQAVRNATPGRPEDQVALTISCLNSLFRENVIKY